MKRIPYYFAGACFASLFLIPFPVGPDRFFWKEFFDAGHVVLFFLLTIVVHRLTKNTAINTQHHIPTVGLFIFATSVLLEMLQPLFDRSWSLEDLLLGTLGIIAACFTLSSKPFDKVLGISAFIIFQIWGVIPALEGLAAIRWRKGHLPLLADFESETQMPMWGALSKRSTAKVGEGTFSLLVQSVPYPHTSYSAGGEDWSTYQNVSFKVYNPETDSRSLSVRIDDSGDCELFDNRYNQSFSLAPGWNDVSIELARVKKGPKTRELDLSHITKIHFFSRGKSMMSSFFIDSLQLSAKNTS